MAQRNHDKDAGKIVEEDMMKLRANKDKKIIIKFGKKNKAERLRRIDEIPIFQIRKNDRYFVN